MQKTTLLNFISTYNTIDKIDAVVWNIEGKKLSARFVSEDKSLLGEVEVNGVESDDTSIKLGIFTTSKLSKLLGVLDDTMSSLSYVKLGDKPINLILKDSVATMEYALSDLAVIPVVPSMKYVPEDYQLSFKINSDFAGRYLKAISALSEINTFSIKSISNSKASVTLGQTDVNTNRITINVDTIKNDNSEPLEFNAIIFSQILMANKGLEPVIEFNNKGLARVIFDTESYKATYYLVAKKVA